VQRFGSALNLNIHFHCLVLAHLLERIVKRLLKRLIRQGYLVQDQGETYLEGEDEECALSNLQAAATSYRIGLGPRQGKKLHTLKQSKSRRVPVPNGACKTTASACMLIDVSCEAENVRSWKNCAATWPDQRLPTRG